MKKLLILLTAMLCVSPFAKADDDGDEMMIGISSDASNTFAIGLKAGATINTMTQPNECDLYEGSDMGYVAGLAMNMRFGKITESSPAGTGYFGLGLEVNYRLSSVKTIGSDGDTDNVKLSLGYLDVPVSVQIYPLPMAANTFYIEAGCSFGLLMSKSPKTLVAKNLTGDYSQVTYDIDGLKGGAVSPLVGLGYTFPTCGLGLHARYYMGMTELAGNFPCKMSSLEISASWKFSVDF